MALNQIVTRLLHNIKCYQNHLQKLGVSLTVQKQRNYEYDNVLYKARTVLNIYTDELHIHYKIRRQDNIYKNLRTEK